MWVQINEVFVPLPPIKPLGSWCVCVCVCVYVCVYLCELSHVWLFGTPWTKLLGSSVHAIFQSRILEWLPLPTPGNLPNPGIEPETLSPVLAGGFFTSCATWKLGGVSPHLSQNISSSYCYVSCNPFIIWDSEPTLWNTVLKENDLALLGWYKGRERYKFWK